MSSPSAVRAAACPGCGTEVAGALLRCPGCRRLVHAERLARLATEAERDEAEGRASEALVLWREALDLLPPDAEQGAVIQRRIGALGQVVNERAPDPPAPHFTKRFGPVLGGGLLVLWKAKVLVLFLLTKAKFLLLGLTKASTLFSMFAAAGVYWALWGWKFALGIVGSIYVHEMGHVAALRRYGIKASAPMFLPGIGAVVRLKQHPATAAEDARVGLAGPIWGLGAALAAYTIYLATGAPIWGAIAHFGAWVNLFNLLPVWQLDGGRGFRALSRRERWIAAGALTAIWAVTTEPLVLLLALAGGVSAMSASTEQSDRGALTTYVGLAMILAVLSRIPVPGVSR